MGKLQKTLELPELGCTRQDIYDLVETLDPTTEIVDDDTIEIVTGKFFAKLRVPRYKKITVGYIALQKSALTNDIELLLLNGGGVIEQVVMKHSEEFVGTGISGLDLSVGISGTLDKYGADFDVLQAVGDLVFEHTQIIGLETFNGLGTSIRIGATAVGANLDQLTAGSVDIWVKYAACI